MLLPRRNAAAGAALPTPPLNKNCATADGDGIRLAVRLTPRANRTALAGVTAGADGRPALHIRLAAPPVDNAANVALIAYLADCLGVRKADVTIRSGAASRTKLLHIAGEPEALLALAMTWITAA